jgi:ankyrin repeat protein
MSKSLPDRPNLDQYRKQAKDLLHAHRAADPAALERIRQHHPTLHNLPLDQIPSAPFTLADAQLILAREHSFESWPRFAAHITTLNLIRSLADIHNPVAAFIEFACAPRHSGHATGTLEHAQLILSRYPHVATANIHTATILADEPTVRAFLSRDPSLATQKGGPHQWDALTHLCFSRYLRLDESRSDAFVRTAQALLDAGASAATGWYETIDHPTPRPLFESALYGAAAIARHPALTQLLLDHGADPNDEETPYHVPETYDNTVLKILLASGKLNPDSLNTILLRKADWHDEDGMQLALEHGVNPNQVTRWGLTALHQSLRSDNGLIIIELLLNHGADPTIATLHHGTAAQIAARRGRGDALDLFAQRNITITLSPLDQLIAACAQNNDDAIHALTTAHPNLTAELLAQGGTLPALGGTLLAQFAGNNNAAGIRHLLALGVSPTALYPGDPYFEIPRDSTALHVAAWRAQPAAVQLLIESGTPINALDGSNRTALQLAIRAATDSYWKHRRTTESIEALLKAGATQTNVTLPTGYPEADALIERYRSKPS